MKHLVWLWSSVIALFDVTVTVAVTVAVTIAVGIGATITRATITPVAAYQY